MASSTGQGSFAGEETKNFHKTFLVSLNVKYFLCVIRMMSVSFKKTALREQD
jgi:hypothetical protein